MHKLKRRERKKKTSKIKEESLILQIRWRFSSTNYVIEILHSALFSYEEKYCTNFLFVQNTHEACIWNCHGILTRYFLRYLSNATWNIHLRTWNLRYSCQSIFKLLVRERKILFTLESSRHDYLQQSAIARTLLIEENTPSLPSSGWMDLISSKMCVTVPTDGIEGKKENPPPPSDFGKRSKFFANC